MHSKNCSTARTHKKTGTLLGLTLLGLSPLTVAGAELRSLTLSLEDGRYRMVSETLFGPDRDAIYAVLTDFDQYSRFSSTILKSRNVEPDGDGRPRFYLLMRGCVLFVCRSFVRNGHLLLTPKYDIVAITDPEASDFKYSRERWQLSDEGSGTVMLYEFEMEPRFWVPPVIGPYLIKRTLRAGSIRVVDRIEAIARGEEPRR